MPKIRKDDESILTPSGENPQKEKDTAKVKKTVLPKSKVTEKAKASPKSAPKATKEAKDTVKKTKSPPKEEKELVKKLKIQAKAKKALSSESNQENLAEGKEPIKAHASPEVPLELPLEVPIKEETKAKKPRVSKTKTKVIEEPEAKEEQETKEEQEPVKKPESKDKEKSISKSTAKARPTAKKPQASKSPALLKATENASSLKGAKPKYIGPNKISPKKAQKPLKPIMGLELAALVYETLQKHKILSPVLINLRGFSQITDYFFIATAESSRQIKAIAEKIVACLKEHDIRPYGLEGLNTTDTRWGLLDFGDIIVHIFLTEARILYDLEGLWADAPRVDLSSLSPKKTKEKKENPKKS
jgi:ribosome-associated protein